MDVVILGSGTAVPSPDRFPAGYLVRHEGRNYLVDLGPGVLRRIGQLGLDLDAIHGVFLTHYHTDHCADVAALLFGLRNPRYAGRSPLHLFGGVDGTGRGPRAFLEDLERTWRWCRAGDYELHVNELGPGPIALSDPGLRVTAVSIEHTDASLGYRFETADGQSAAFTGDAVQCDGAVELARGVQFFVCDSALPHGDASPGHMTTTEAGRTAALAGVRTLCLTHFYPQCEGHDLVAEAAAEFDGRIELARDLWAFDCSTGVYRAL